MIIKRELCTYGQLMFDEFTRSEIKKVYEKHGLSEEDMRNQMGYVHNVLVLNTEMGSGIPGKVYFDLKQLFERLDLEKPFDNGMTYKDVTDSCCFSSRKGNAIMQWLINRTPDCVPLIVQVVAFERDGQYIKAIEPWDVSGTVSF